MIFPIINFREDTKSVAKDPLDTRVVVRCALSAEVGVAKLSKKKSNIRELIVRAKTCADRPAAAEVLGERRARRDTCLTSQSIVVYPRAAGDREPAPRIGECVLQIITLLNCALVKALQRLWRTRRGKEYVADLCRLHQTHIQAAFHAVRRAREKVDIRPKAELGARLIADRAVNLVRIFGIVSCAEDARLREKLSVRRVIPKCIREQVAGARFENRIGISRWITSFIKLHQAEETGHTYLMFRRQIVNRFALHIVEINIYAVRIGIIIGYLFFQPRNIMKHAGTS